VAAESRAPSAVLTAVWMLPTLLDNRRALDITSFGILVRFELNVGLPTCWHESDRFEYTFN